jgi:hypothetical protein
MKELIKESLLHLIWRDQSRYLVANPTLSDGSPITIIHPGTHNELHAGPDFQGAKIAIDGIVLTGDVEIHKTFDDWQAHSHTGDTNYSQVILHVVLEFDEDADLKEPNIPTLILKDNLDFSHRAFWQELFEKRYARAPELPCYPHNLAIPMRTKRKLVAKMGEARLDELVGRFDKASQEKFLDNIYERILDALGYSENREPFKMLSSILPRTLLQEIREKESTSNLPVIFEALYFGASGLLEQPSAEYTNDVNEYLLDLNAKWNELQASYPITETLAESDWRFFRIRPTNTPYRRIALAAALAQKYFSRKDFSIYEEIAYETANPFWMKRTSYKSELPEVQELLGEERRRAMHLNVILPARIASSDKQSKELRNEWLELGSRSSARYGEVIEQELMESEHLRSVGADQGALFLYRNYCTRTRCSECMIGQKLIEKKLM